MQRRGVLATLLLSAVVAGPALAQSYPERAVKLVVPYAPGGSADIAARLIADEWAKALGGTMFTRSAASPQSEGQHE
jgi:tripartite-type tricarboxylate transporter receptor subunit TctC